MFYCPGTAHHSVVSKCHLCYPAWPSYGRHHPSGYTSAPQIAFWHTTCALRYFVYMKMWYISIWHTVWQRHKLDILQLRLISAIYYSLTTPLHANSCSVLLVGQFQELKKHNNLKALFTVLGSTRQVWRVYFVGRGLRLWQQTCGQSSGLSLSLQHTNTHTHTLILPLYLLNTLRTCIQDT